MLLLLYIIFGASSVIQAVLSASFCLQLWPSSLFTRRPESWDRARFPLSIRNWHFAVKNSTKIIPLDFSPSSVGCPSPATRPVRALRRGAVVCQLPTGLTSRWRGAGGLTLVLGSVEK